MGIAFLALALVAGAARAVDTYVAAETSYVSWASQALDARLAEAIQTSIVTQAGAATNFYLGADAPWATAAGRDAVAHALYAHMTSVDASVYHLWAAFEDGGFLGYYNEGVGTRASSAPRTAPASRRARRSRRPPRGRGRCRSRTRRARPS
jgi:hypothetical protein